MASLRLVARRPPLIPAMYSIIRVRQFDGAHQVCDLSHCGRRWNAVKEGGHERGPQASARRETWMQVSDPLAQLEELLAEDIGEATRRASWTLDRVAGTLGERPMVLFGAGSLGHKTLTGLRALGAEPAALTDNDPTKWGSSVDNVPVVAPQEAVERWGGNGIFIVTILSPERRFTEVDSQLKRAGCTNVLPYAALA